MHSTRRLVTAVVAAALLVVPLTVVASHGFTDVPDSNVFHSDIDWLADADVTRGCNPPANDQFCPSDNVTREQMAAFMRRLANNQVVDAGSVNGMTADEIIAAASPEAPTSDAVNYLVEMSIGDEPVVLAEIGPLTYTGYCVDDAGDTLGYVELVSTEDLFVDTTSYTAGEVVDVEDLLTSPGEPDYDYWYDQIVVPGTGVYIADDGYDHTIYLEYGDVDCAFAGTFFPHFRNS